MTKEVDLGFVAPTIPSSEIPPEPSADPFEQLLCHDEPSEAGTEETFANLEEEYRILVGLRRRRDEAAARATETAAEYEAQRSRMLRAMLAQGTKQFKSAAIEGGSCHFNPAYSVKISDPTTFLPWAKKNCEELLSVNSRTLTRHVREQFRNRGVPIDDPSFPPGVEVEERDTLTVTVPKE